MVGAPYPQSIMSSQRMLNSMNNMTLNNTKKSIQNNMKLINKTVNSLKNEMKKYNKNVKKTNKNMNTLNKSINKVNKNSNKNLNKNKLQPFNQKIIPIAN